MDTCTFCSEEPLKCPECKCGCDLDPTTDLEDGDVVECMGCGEESYYWAGQLIDSDTYHENYCDSQAAERDEESAHGDDREHYISGGRWEGGYRNGREDFRSDC